MNNALMVSTMTFPLIDVCSTHEEYLNERFRFLRECGIEAIDLNIDSFEEGTASIQKGIVSHFWDKELDELYQLFTPLKNAARRSGIAFSQMHAVPTLYVEGNEEVTEYVRMSVEKNIAIAAFLNCPAVVVHPYSCQDKAREIEINLALYRRLMPAAKKYGVTICLENLFQGINGRGSEGACSTAEEACWYIDKLNAEAGADVFGFCLDIGHANLLRRSIKSFITRLGSRLVCLHIHDNDGQYDTHAMPFTHTIGWGSKYSTDWDGMLEGLREINYRGNLSFEAFKTFLLFPKELEANLLTLYAGIGRYFRDRVLNG